MKYLNNLTMTINENDDSTSIIAQQFIIYPDDGNESPFNLRLSSDQCNFSYIIHTTLQWACNRLLRNISSTIYC